MKPSGPSAPPSLDIVAVFNQTPEAGGGFHQSLNSLAALADACRGRHRLRVLALKGGLPDVDQLVQLLPALREVEWVSVSGSDPKRAGVELLRQLRMARLIRHVPRRWRKPSKARFVDGLGADFIYFLSPNTLALALVRTPYVMTVWDVCHLDHPEFPEVREDGEFERRETFFRRALPQALLVVTDSEVLSDRLHRRYGVDRDRLVAQPFRPSPFLEASSASTEVVLAEYRLEKGYWFYPAQFWAHKNHVRVLEALVILRERGLEQRAVFTGSDKGFRSVVEGHVSRLGLDGSVQFLGFVPSEHLRALYFGSIGLVFPSYFGPTNLPPLEALALGRPVVCSGFHEPSLGPGPTYFDPDDPVELADAMEATVRDSAAAPELVARTGAAPASAQAAGTRRTSDVGILIQRIDVIARRLGMLRLSE